MFDNIGNKVKGLSAFLCWAGIIASSIAAIAIWASGGTFLLGALYLVVGCLSAWIGSWVTYAIGYTAEKVRLLSLEVTALKKQLADASRKDAPVVNDGPPPLAAAQIDTADRPDAASASQPIDLNKNAVEDTAWTDLGNHFVQCPQCGSKMTIDFIRARKQCHKCGRKYNA